MNGTTLVFSLLAAGSGVCLAVQAAVNSKFRENLHNPAYAVFFSICGTVVVACVAMALLRPPAPSAAALRDTQWWNWLGGPLGALIVLAGAMLTRYLGAGAFIALVVAGQVLSSLLLDHFALMGLKEQPLTPGRALGALLVIAGAVCVKVL